MKRLTCLALAAAFLMLPCHKSQAPISIFARIAINCIMASGVGTTAIILFRCEPSYYLCRYQVEGEDTFWSCSQASVATLAKTGGVRCEGPWKDRAEPDLRAWVNNHEPEHPMYPCGPLGAPIPGPTWTNYSIVSLQHSTDGGRQWRFAGEVAVARNESNWSVCLLGPAGTNGMNRAELREVMDCDVVIPNAIPALSEIKSYRVRGFVTTVPSELVRTGRGRMVSE